MNFSLVSNGSHTFSAFHCAQAAQSNVYAELRLPASPRAGQRGTCTSVKESESSYCIYPLFWRHWILVALVKPEAGIPRMKGFTSIKRVPASVLWESPILGGFVVPHGSAMGAVQGSLLGRDRVQLALSLWHRLRRIKILKLAISEQLSFCSMTPFRLCHFF